MPQNDPFTCSLRNDLKARGLTIPDAAEKAFMSPRQFARHLRGETKEGIMPPPTVAALNKNGILSPETNERYIERIRMKINSKKAFRKKKDPIKGLARFVTTILSYFNPEINVSRQRHL